MRDDYIRVIRGLQTDKLNLKLQLDAAKGDALLGWTTAVLAMLLVLVTVINSKLLGCL